MGAACNYKADNVVRCDCGSCGMMDDGPHRIVHADALEKGDRKVLVHSRIPHYHHHIPEDLHSILLCLPDPFLREDASFRRAR